MAKFSKFKRFFINFLFLILVVGCFQRKEEDKLYFSVRAKQYNQSSQSEWYSDYSFSELSLYGHISEVGVVTHFNNYSSGLYDKDENTIYYINRHFKDDDVRENDGDQLYSYNIKTNDICRHTSLLYGNNYVFKEGKTVYLVSQMQTHGQQLVKLNLENDELNLIGPGDDYNVRAADYNPVTKEIVFSAYSESEWQNAHNDLDYVPPNNTVFSFMDDKVEELFQTGNGEIGEIVANQDAVVYFRNLTILHNGENTGLEEIENSYFTYDRKTKETTKGVLGKELDNLVNILYLSEDGSYMYAVFKENKRDYQLVRYEFKSGSKKLIHDFQSQYEDADFRIVLMKEE